LFSLIDGAFFMMYPPPNSFDFFSLPLAIKKKHYVIDVFAALSSKGRPTEFFIPSNSPVFPDFLSH